MSCPFTHTLPVSGFSRPRINFNEIDFPAPLAPRMIFVWPRCSSKLTSRRTTVSSNAKETWSNTIIGSLESDCLSMTALRDCDSSMSIKQANHQPRNEEIQHEHGDRCRDDGVRRRTAHALCAPLGAQAHMTTNADDREPEKERLYEPHPDVFHVEPVGDRFPVDTRRHLQLLDGNDAATQNAHEVGDDRQHWRHQH